MNQLNIDFDARGAGEAAGRACLDKAIAISQTFSDVAKQAILNHLQENGSASGEALTNVAIALGAKPHDQRAFGPIFAGLSREGMIRTVGYCTREKGHGTSGGRLWALTPRYFEDRT